MVVKILYLHLHSEFCLLSPEFFLCHFVTVVIMPEVFLDDLRV